MMHLHAWSPLSLLFLSVLFPPCAAARGAEPGGRPNVLFIAVDDLRPELSCFGRPRMSTPALDRIAARGVRFERAYCMVPTCGASRASLMTGIRPASNRFVNYLARADRDAPGVVTLNTHFQSHGYHTVSLGKVFHVPADNQHGWSEPPWRPTAPTYALEESLEAQRANQGPRKRGPPFEQADVDDTFYADGQLAERAVADLRRLAKLEKPFFLAVGFFKPHLPMVAPQPYWERYPAADVALPENYFPPRDAPPAAIHNSGELRAYAGVPPKGKLSDDDARRLIRGYYACVSYTDAQIGKLLDTLDELRLAENTVIVVWGDHGWNLGEHTLWCKHSCFETSLRAPLIIAAPAASAISARGASCSSLTEFIDIYPTLCELASLPKPEHLQGESLATALVEPASHSSPTAISRYGNGDSIRTYRYRYSLYRDKRGRTLGRMLYDHQADPGENVNLAGSPEHRAIVEELEARLLAEMGKPTTP